MSAFKIKDLAISLRTIFKKKNKIKIIGLREGEKSYEKLISSNEYIQEYFKKQHLATVSNKKTDYSNNIDSRYASHLKEKEISKILKSQKKFIDL